MNIKDIKNLASSSFTKGNLDEKKVSRITKALNRSDLRKYINALKLIAQKSTVKVWTSTNLDKKTQESLKSLFKGKKIQTLKDEDLLAGIKIQDFDNIYDLNIKNTLNTMVSHIREN